jgi:hypothetical protein
MAAAHHLSAWKLASLLLLFRAASCRHVAAPVRLRSRCAHCSAVPPPLPSPTLLSRPQAAASALAERSRAIRCPFWRTRANDALESVLAVANFVAARHKSVLDRQWLPGSNASLFEPLALPVRAMGPKTRHLALEDVMDVVRRTCAPLRALPPSGAMVSLPRGGGRRSRLVASAQATLRRGSTT